MKALLLSSLVKVFKDKEPNFKEFSSFSCLKNEVFSFQVALCPESAEEAQVSFKIESELKKNITPYFVKNIPFRRNKKHDYDSFHYDLNRKEFPDLLEPTESSLTLKENEWSSLWFEYKPNGDVSGKHPIKITITSNGKAIEKLFTLDIIDCDLPKQELLYTSYRCR